MPCSCPPFVPKSQNGKKLLWWLISIKMLLSMLYIYITHWWACFLQGKPTIRPVHFALVLFAESKSYSTGYMTNNWCKPEFEIHLQSSSAFSKLWHIWFLPVLSGKQRKTTVNDILHLPVIKILEENIPEVGNHNFFALALLHQASKTIIYIRLKHYFQITNVKTLQGLISVCTILSLKPF